jgi:DNA polymerase I-like protein with 3'-5' exonuclease and polymerase domains
MIDYDVETTGLQPWSGKHYAFMFQFLDDEGNAEALLWSPEDRSNAERIQQWFDRARGQGLRAWNSKFDLAFGEAAGFTMPPEEDWHDGMLEAFAINERRSIALKAVAQELFGEDAADLQKQVKGWLNDEAKRRRKLIKDADKFLASGKPTTDEDHTLVMEAAKFRDEDGSARMPNFSDVPGELMHRYGLEDVFLTRKVCNSQALVFANDVAPPDDPTYKTLRDVVEFERKTMAALYGIEKRGLPASRDNYLRLEKEVIENLELLDDRVMELVREGDPKIYADKLNKHVEVSEDGAFVSVQTGGSLDEFNPRSSAMVHAALLARGADLTFMSEKDGKLPMDADNLRAVHDELAAAILNFRAEEKVLSTYVRPMIGRSYESSIRAWKEPFIAPDGRIHANYRQVGARTGRMSCSDPNMQNQPRDDLRLRYNVEAEPGHVLVTCDLSNIEMVLFAAYCGPGRLLTAVQNGDDLHTLTAEMVGLRDRARPGGGVETARQQGKVYNFTIIYGGGLRSIRRYFRVSMDQARQMKARYNRAYPEVERLQDLITYRLEDDGHIQDKLISGRRFRVDPRDAYKATNYLIQGTAASLLKQAVIDLHADGIPMVALVHDEIVAHVPIEDAREAAHLIEKRMTAAAAPGGPLWMENLNGPLVPLRADADIVHRWSDAKPLKEADGREYYFDPHWAKVERRYVDEQKALVAT